MIEPGDWLEQARCTHLGYGGHHNYRFLIEQHLKTIEHLEETITAFDEPIEAALEPFGDAIERLKEVPGLSETSAKILLAEIGTDMKQFPGAPWLKPVLVQCAHAAAKKKNSYFEAQYLRLKARRGSKEAVIAVAASILKTAYHPPCRRQARKPHPQPRLSRRS